MNGRESDILILGGGFAGLAAVDELWRRERAGVSVRLIDRLAQSEFSPLLPDMISGRVRAGHVRFPIEPFCRGRGAEFTRAEAKAIDPAAGAVETAAGTFRAEQILVALGCETNYFGDQELPRRTVGLKRVDEGLAIRRRAEAALSSGTGPAALLVVGGGYTGIEAASHLADLCRRRTGLRFARLRTAARILVVEKASDILGSVSPKVRRWARRLLERFSVEVRTETTIEHVGDDGSVVLSDGEEFADAVVVWSPGVTPGPAVAALGGEPRVRGRLVVDEFLRVPGRERIFAAGDVAGAVRPGAEGPPLRMGVQFSLMGGRTAARNVLAARAGREMEAFDPWDPGYIVPLAPGKAAGRIMGLPFRGRLPYGMHYFLCMFRSWGWPNRLGVLGDVLRRAE